MTTQTPPTLETHIPWIKATDAHAMQRIDLLRRVAASLSVSAGGNSAEREAIARRLERWRYQHLNARCEHLSGKDWHLLDDLDQVERELSGRKPRPPRGPRRVVHDERFAREQTRLAARALDRSRDLSTLARHATEVTEGGGTCQAERPSRRMLLYAPLYVSSYCINHCTYCGFRYPLDIPRKHLSVDEAVAEAELLGQRGFRHLLVVGGDFPSKTTVRYYAEILDSLRARGFETAVEIAPMPTDEYAQLARSGACGVTLYQETYLEGPYRGYHTKGPKTSYDWRLEGLDRAGEAGMRRLGIGILLGLSEPVRDYLALVRHGHYLQDRFPESTLAFSLPRIHEAPQGFRPAHQVDDELFVRMYCGLRLAFPGAELVLSTREPVELRNRLAKICITQMSAGSCTAPGGYHETLEEGPTGQQFPVTDHRGIDDVVAWLRDNGLAVRWSSSEAKR